VKVSGDITSGNVPEFDGTTGAIKDSGKAASDIPDGTSSNGDGNGDP
jgi:hypothetical protein